MSTHPSARDPLAKNDFLAVLCDRNEVLYYKLLEDHLTEMLDVGTDRESLLNDPPYVGNRHRRRRPCPIPQAGERLDRRRSRGRRSTWAQAHQPS